MVCTVVSIDRHLVFLSLLLGASLVALAAHVPPLSFSAPSQCNYWSMVRFFDASCRASAVSVVTFNPYGGAVTPGTHVISCVWIIEDTHRKIGL